MSVLSKEELVALLEAAQARAEAAEVKAATAEARIQQLNEDLKVSKANEDKAQQAIARYGYMCLVLERYHTRNLTCAVNFRLQAPFQNH